MPYRHASKYEQHALVGTNTTSKGICYTLYWTTNGHRPPQETRQIRAAPVCVCEAFVLEGLPSMRLGLALATTYVLISCDLLPRLVRKHSISNLLRSNLLRPHFDLHMTGGHSAMDTAASKSAKHLSDLPSPSVASIIRAARSRIPHSCLHKCRERAESTLLREICVKKKRPVVAGGWALVFSPCVRFDDKRHQNSREECGAYFFSSWWFASCV